MPNYFRYVEFYVESFFVFFCLRRLFAEKNFTKNLTAFIANLTIDSYPDNPALFSSLLPPQALMGKAALGDLYKAQLLLAEIRALAVELHGF